MMSELKSWLVFLHKEWNVNDLYIQVGQINFHSIKMIIEEPVRIYGIHSSFFLLTKSNC